MEHFAKESSVPYHVPYHEWDAVVELENLDIQLSRTTLESN